MDDDSACMSCKHCKAWSENPNADAGGYYEVSYYECTEGCEDNFTTRYGCMNYEENKINEIEM